jgi:DNA mismatch repair protein MutL
MAAYDILKMAQPSYFFILTVPPNTIDINIHPTKTEVKFDDEHALYAIFLEPPLSIVWVNLMWRPFWDFDQDSNLDTPYHYRFTRSYIHYSG